MDRSEIIAEQIARLVPELIRGMRAGLTTFPPQLTHSQIVTLINIYEKGITRVGELSKQMRVSAPTITGTIDRLLRNGYLKRTHDSKDRRVVNVELTGKGRKAVEQLRSEIKKKWQVILTRLTNEERENYLRILKRIVEVLNKENA